MKASLGAEVTAMLINRYPHPWRWCGKASVIVLCEPPTVPQSWLLRSHFFLILTRLAHYQNGVPPHQDRQLPGSEPATLYLAGSSNQPGPENPFFQSFPLPVARYGRPRSYWSTASHRIA
jgi:hypothetical protein